MTSDTWRRETLSIDQQPARKTAATNRARNFEGIFGAETIERFPHSSYDEFAGRSQMALGFFTHRAGDKAIAWSGGSEPASSINPAC